MESFYTNFYILYGFFTLIILFDVLGSFFEKKLIYIKYQNIIIFLFLAAYYVLLSTRDLSVGVDTDRYFRFYKEMYLYGDSIIGSDIGFNLFNKLLITCGISPNNYLFFLSLLFVVPIYYAIKQFKGINKVFLLWFFASLFIFISLSTNVLRQGIGGAFVIWGISIFLNRTDDNKRFLMPLIIAPFFHFSLLLVILLFFVSKYVKNIKVAYVILFITIVLSYMKFDLNTVLSNLPVIGNLFLDRMEGYMGENVKNYKIGFRIDFFLFNLFFVFIGHYISKLKFIKSNYPLYGQIYTTYILLTSYFILMFNVPFSDRFGILSWTFIPFIMYPIFDLSSFKYNNLKLGSVILGVSLFIVFNVLGI